MGVTTVVNGGALLPGRISQLNASPMRLMAPRPAWTAARATNNTLLHVFKYPTFPHVTAALEPTVVDVSSEPHSGCRLEGSSVVRNAFGTVVMNVGVDNRGAPLDKVTLLTSVGDVHDFEFTNSQGIHRPVAVGTTTLLAAPIDALVSTAAACDDDAQRIDMTGRPSDDVD